MPLESGARLGPYEILSRIGKGGMGEVYRARDTRLDRIVAVKVSSREFGERFQREAQVIASLSHPNICTLHDAGADYLVMEFLEGTEIRGPLPIAEALRLAIQIADAVSYAHKKGVIHRDLKPSNILLTKAGAKVLDFGLAKFSHGKPAADSSEGDLAATLTHVALTQQGVLIGTPQYMAPEQLEGQEADRRSDIFAFGLVLYEMLTGRAAFAGKTQANVIAAILAAEPTPAAALQPLIPPALDHLIKTCLDKDPANRRQDMHDVLIELQWIAQSGSQAGVPRPVIAHRKRREGIAWTLAATAGIAALTLAFLHFRESPPPAYPFRFEIPQHPNSTLHQWHMVSVSPDGRAFAHAFTQPDSRTILSVRRLDSVQPVMLAGTEGSEGPFWSPDSRSIAFFAQGQLKKVDAGGGAPQVITETSGFTGSWSNDGSILIGRVKGPVDLIPAGGGAPAPLLKLDEARKEVGQVNPHFLPDGRSFLYTSLSRVPGQGGIYLSSLDSKTSRRLADGESNAVYVSPGFLLFARGSTLVAQRFDLRKLQLEGEPLVVTDAVGRIGTPAPVYMFSASPNGVLVYRPSFTTQSRIRSIERTGRPLGPIGDSRAYLQFSLSPDEKHLAAQIADSRVGTSYLWQMDLATAILSRVTSDPAVEELWSPDGRELIFVGTRTQGRGIYRKLVGGGDEKLIVGQKLDGGIWPAFLLNDGSLVYHNDSGRSVFLLPPGQNAKPRPLFVTDYGKDAFRLSPDGRWITYDANESGRWEVYVASFPEFSGRRQVSNNGGVQGYWRKDGKELFYLSLDGNIVSTEVKTGEKIETGVPQVLFQTRILVSPTAEQFAATGDGRRFFVLEPAESDVRPFTVILNWQATVPR